MQEKKDQLKPMTDEEVREALIAMLQTALGF